MSTSLVALNAASTLEDAVEADLWVTIAIHPLTKERWQAAASALRIACGQGICIEERHQLGSPPDPDFVTFFKPVRYAGAWSGHQVIILFDPHKP